MNTPQTNGDDRPLFLRIARPRHHTNGNHRPTTATLTVNPTDAKPYAMKALAEEVAAVTTATEGTRNDTLNTAGFNLSQLVASGYLDHDTTWHALHTAALHAGLPEHEVTGTLRSAFRAGTTKPRLVAQLDHDPETDLPDPGTIPPALGKDPEDPDPTDAPTSLRDRFPALRWHDLWNKRTEDEWIVYPVLPARRLVALFSPPKVGKSLFMLELAARIAQGVEVLGHTPDRPRRVLYVDFENDPEGDIRPRLQGMGFKPDDLENLVYLSYPRLAYLDTNIGGLELLAIAREYDCEVVVIDTISRAVSGEENDNDTWLGFYRNTGQLLKAEGIATIRLDHTGKDATKGMRGGSAKYGDVDAVWAMTRVTDTTLKLECTANRLPIAEKVLHVDRVIDPHLRHKVNTQGRQAAIDAQVPGILAYLESVDFPPEGGVPAAWKLLKDKGLGTKAAVEEAIWRRKHPQQPSLSAYVFKDD